jgi:hypothetical protein
LRPALEPLPKSLSFLDLAAAQSQTDFMPHTYLLFDFATDEEKAQRARHKLETWKQAFRLDKKLLYKFDRAASVDGEELSGEEKPVKTGKTKGASKAKSESGDSGASSKEPVKLLVRLAFSGHEKLSEQRWVERIPSEMPFQEASPKVIKPDDRLFPDTEKQFEDLA